MVTPALPVWGHSPAENVTWFCKLGECGLHGTPAPGSQNPNLEGIFFIFGGGGSHLVVLRDYSQLIAWCLLLAVLWGPCSATDGTWFLWSTKSSLQSFELFL